MENIRKYLHENKEIIRKELEWAARNSFSISEGYCEKEKISVAITDTFELKSVISPLSYSFPVNVIYVLHEFEGETYIVDYDDIKNFLNDEQIALFNEMLLLEELASIELEKEELMELSREDQLSKVIEYIESERRVLELFKQFDKELYNDYLDKINETVDTSFVVEHALDRMFDNLQESSRS